CNGVEACTQGMCTAGAPPSCDDGASCTSDACDAAKDACVHTANDAACNDGKFCDGVEKCDPPNGAPGTGCTPSSGSPCDDGIACTVDACDEASKLCSNTPMDAACNDGLNCDGVETCSIMIGCVAGKPLDCDDNIACTADFCSPQTDSCA